MVFRVFRFRTCDLRIGISADYEISENISQIPKRRTSAPSDIKQRLVNGAKPGQQP